MARWSWESFNRTLKRDLELFKRGERAAMSEFKLKRTTREWEHRGARVSVNDNSDVEISDGARCNCCPTYMKVILHPDTLSALSRLWERELRPAHSDGSEFGGKASPCISEFTQPITEQMHRCSMGPSHTDFHNRYRLWHVCKCGFEWE